MGQFDYWNKEIKEGISGKAGKAFLGLQVAAVVTGENKLKEVLKLVRDLVLWRPMLNMLFVGMFASLGKGIRSLVHDTGSLHAAMSKLRTIQGLEKSLAPFVAGIENAKRKVAELVNFAARKNLSLGEAGGAARSLAASTRGAAGIGDLDKLNDAAKATGNTLGDLTDRTGELYSTLRDKGSIEGVVEGLRSVGAISQTAADSLIAMQQSGASGPQIWDAYMQSLNRFQGGADAAKDSIEEVTTAHEAAKKALMEKFGSPFVASDVQNTKNWTDAMKAILPAISEVSEFLGMLFQGMKNATSATVKWIAESGIAGAVIRTLGFAIAPLLAIVSLLAASGLAKWLNAVAFSAKNMAAATAWAEVNVKKLTGSIVVAEFAAKGLSLAMRGLNFAMKALGWVSLILTAIELGGALIGLSKASDESKKEMDDLKKSHDDANRALEDQINNIQTLTDKHEAFQNALRATAEAQEEFNKFSRPGADQKGRQQALDNLMNRRNLLGMARGASVTASPELVREQIEQQQALERGQRQAAMQSASPEGRVLLTEAERKRLEGRTKIGLAMPKAEEDTKKQVQELMEQREEMKANPKKFGAKAGRLSTYTKFADDIIKAQEDSKSPADNAKGAISRIEAAGHLREALEPGSGASRERIETLRTQAAHYGGASPGFLKEERRKEDAALFRSNEIKGSAKSESEQLAAMPSTQNEKAALKLTEDRANIEAQIAGSRKTGYALVKENHKIAMQLLAAEERSLNKRTNVSQAERTALESKRREEIRSFELSSIANEQTKISVSAEEKKAGLKSRGFARSSEESKIAIEALDKEIDIENRKKGGPDENRLRDLKARKQEAEIAAGMNREDVTYARQDANFELEKQKARKTGNAQEEKRIGYVQEGLHLYQQVRSITDNDQQAMDYTKQFMTGKIGMEMAQSAMSADQQAAVSSLARIGGGGGVEETSGGLLDVARETNNILKRVEENTRMAANASGYDDTLSQNRRQ